MDGPRNYLSTEEQFHLISGLFSPEQMQACIQESIKQKINLEIEELRTFVKEDRIKKEAKKLECDNKISKTSISELIDQLNTEITSIGETKKVNLSLFSAEGPKQIDEKNKVDIFSICQKIQLIFNLKILAKESKKLSHEDLKGKIIIEEIDDLTLKELMGKIEILVLKEIQKIKQYFESQLEFIRQDITDLGLLRNYPNTDIKKIIVLNEGIREKIFNLHQKIQLVLNPKISLENSDKLVLNQFKNKAFSLMKKRISETDEIILKRKNELVEQAQYNSGFEKNKINYNQQLSSLNSKVNDWTDLLLNTEKSLADASRMVLNEIEPITKNSINLISDSESEDENLKDSEFEKASEIKDFIERQNQLLNAFSRLPKNKRTKNIKESVEEFLKFKADADKTIEQILNKIQTLNQKFKATLLSESMSDEVLRSSKTVTASDLENRIIDTDYENQTSDEMSKEANLTSPPPSFVFDKEKTPLTPQIFDTKELKAVLQSTQKYIPNCLIEGPVRKRNEKKMNLSKKIINLSEQCGKLIIKMDLLNTHFLYLQIFDFNEPIYKFRSEINNLDSFLSSVCNVFNDICVGSFISLIPANKEPDRLKLLVEKLLSVPFYLEKPKIASYLKYIIKQMIRELPKILNTLPQDFEDLSQDLKDLLESQEALNKAPTDIQFYCEKILFLLEENGSLFEIKKYIDKILPFLKVNQEKGCTIKLDLLENDLFSVKLKKFDKDSPIDQKIPVIRQVLQKFLLQITLSEAENKNILKNQEGILQLLINCQDLLIKFFNSNLLNSEFSINAFNDKRVLIRNRMIESLKEFSILENNVEKNYTKYIKNCSKETNPWYIKSFEDQKNKLLEELKKQKNILINKYNRSCFRLEELSCALYTLEKSINLEFGMGLCSLTPYEIIVCLRNVRKIETSRKLHEDKCKTYQDSFNVRKSYIDEQTNDKLRFNPKDQDFFNLMGEYNLKSLIYQTKKILNERKLTQEKYFSGNDLTGQMEKIGLVWPQIIIESKKHLAGDDFNKQFIDFWKDQCKKLEIRIQNIEDEFKRLPDLYQKAKTELDLVAHTLNTTPILGDYDDIFNKAYYSKNLVMGSFQYAGAALANSTSAIVSYGTNMITSLWEDPEERDVLDPRNILPTQQLNMVDLPKFNI